MDIKLRCILLDDEIPGLTYLKLLCEQIPGLEVVRAFNDSSKFLKESKDLNFDFTILDIEMPGLSGLEVATLGKKPVIFTTAYKEYAAEAFDLEAIDYIRKPVQKERLEKAIAKAAKLLQERSLDKEYVQLNTDKGKALIFFDQILYITTAERDKRDKILLLEDGKILTLKNISFDQLLYLLPERKFCRINKKDIIAIKTVRFITQDEITTSISSPSVFILGDIYRESFLGMLSR